MTTTVPDSAQKMDVAEDNEQIDHGVPSNSQVIDDEAAALVIQEDTKDKAKDEEDDSGSDDEHRLALNVVHSRHLPPDFQTLGKERSVNESHIRIQQAISHMSLTEDRILQLEELVRNMQKTLYKLPEDFHKPNITKHFVYAHELRRSTSSDFNRIKETYDLAKSQVPALEVLVSEKMRPTGLAEMTSGKRPERLRVRYRPLIRHLETVTKSDIIYELDFPPRKTSKQRSVVFLSPFKLFSIYEQEIRDSLKELQAEIDKKAEDQQTKARMKQSDTQDATATESKGEMVSNNKQDKKVELNYNKTDLLTDLGLLVRFLDEDLHETFELRSKIGRGIDTAIEYPDLWHLFRLGEIVIQKAGSQTFAWRVYNFTGGREPLIDKLERQAEAKPQRLDGFTIDAVSLVSKGNSEYTPRFKTFVIRPYLGGQQITSLPVYPLKFAESSVKENIRQQGARYLELTSVPYLHKAVKGKTRSSPQIEVDGHVIVDMTMAYAESPHLQLPTDEVLEAKFTQPDKRETKILAGCDHSSQYVEGCCGFDYAHKDQALDGIAQWQYIQQHARELKTRPMSELTEEDHLTLPESVHGFLLRSRRWIVINTCDLSPVTFTNSFDSLLLPDRHKSAIQSMVHRHRHRSSGPTVSTATSSIGSGIDVVKGKGTGLIFLLHGAPGVGKTMTAECVADDSARPLLPITCGDIGDTATQVEDNLHRNFNMAQKWDCVLLLDEADVFLGKRTKLDLTRNAVVSVFLRSLEYYTGILFLTTNRVGGIDSAFKSRIHMSLYYPPLGLEETLNLYRKFIDRVHSEQERTNRRLFKVKEKEILSFARRHFKKLYKDNERLGTWNGRQIRNAFQAAIALVEYEGQTRHDGSSKATLGKTHFKVVAESSEEFERYLLSTLQQTDTEIAQVEQVRGPDYPNAGEVHIPIAREYPPTLARSSKSRKRSKHAAKDSESESTSDEDDDSESDEDDD